MKFPIILAIVAIAVASAAFWASARKPTVVDMMEFAKLNGDLKSMYRDHVVGVAIPEVIGEINEAWASMRPEDRAIINLTAREYVRKEVAQMESSTPAEVDRAAAGLLKVLEPPPKSRPAPRPRPTPRPAPRPRPTPRPAPPVFPVKPPFPVKTPAGVVPSDPKKLAAAQAAAQAAAVKAGYASPFMPGAPGSYPVKPLVGKPLVGDRKKTIAVPNQTGGKKETFESDTYML